MTKQSILSLWRMDCFASLAMTDAETLRVRPETSGRIAEFSEHEAD